MAVFIMFGKYSKESLKAVSAQRTKKAIKVIEKNGGKVISMYAVMGEHDLLFTMDFPDAEAAISASIGLNMLTGIAFSTSPVIDVDTFDRLVSKAEKI
jgi:uncharacterized protein with GYD domain